MTLLSTTNRQAPYAGNGVTTAFAFTPDFFAATDLKVILRTTATGVGVLQTITTDYTVTGGIGGGTVTMVVAPPTGTELLIIRDTALTQGVDLPEGGPATSLETNIETPLNRLTAITQRLNELVKRSLRLADEDPTDETNASWELGTIADRTGYLKFSAAGYPEYTAGTSNWITKAGVPTGSDGVDGDMCLNTANGDVYGPKATTWTLAANITGPTGPSAGGLSKIIVFGYPTTYSNTFTTNFASDANQLTIAAAPTEPFRKDKTAWRLTTTGTLPAGLSLATDYYITTINSTSTIELSLTPHGTPVTLTGNGTGTHTIAPLGIYTRGTFTRAKVTAVAAGAGGGNANATDSRGSGGGGGETSVRLLEYGDIGATETITVGAGGAAATGGANSSFGSLVTAIGGAAGVSDILSSNDATSGGLGGTGGVGDYSMQGGDGTSGAGGPSDTATGGGVGGSSSMAGTSGGSTTGSASSTIAGLAGKYPGGGGAGGNTQDTDNAAGGVGASGIIIIEEIA